MAVVGARVGLVFVLWSWVAACGGESDDRAAEVGAGFGAAASDEDAGEAATSSGAGAAGTGGTGGSSAGGNGSDDDAGAGSDCAPRPQCRDGGAGGGAICSAFGDCEEVVALAPAQHIDGDIDYGPLPPAGGPHDPCWGDFGVHDEPFAAEHWVHNLEHGAVVVLHRCPSGCADEITALEAFVNARSWAILTAYDDMATRFGIVAWGYRLLADDLDLDAFAAFYDAHADHAPESIASGKPSACP